MNKSFSNNCTIVVSTCDAYEDLWDAFFKILSMAWPNLELPVVLNTEHKSYSTSYITNLTVHNQKENTDIAWSKRLKDTLREIDTDYVIFMLDDFFSKSPIDVARIEQCYEWMERDPRVAVFYFMQAVNDRCIPSKKYAGFEKKRQCADYKYTCQAGIWRRECLINALADNENPWQFELEGTFRSYRDFKHDFYTLIPESGYIIDYIDFIGGRPLGGLPVCRGRWYKPCVEPIFEKYGVEMDFEKRGFIEAEEICPSVQNGQAPLSLRPMDIGHQTALPEGASQAPLSLRPMDIGHQTALPEGASRIPSQSSPDEYRASDSSPLEGASRVLKRLYHKIYRGCENIIHIVKGY